MCDTQIPNSPGDFDPTNSPEGQGVAGAMMGNPGALLVPDEYQPFGDKMLGGRGGGGPEASTLRAQIAREQWQDYKTRFQPIENVLLGYANNPEQYKQQNKDAALGRVGDVYNRAPAQIERRMTAYGLQVTPEDRQRIQQKTDYQRGLASVQAANMTDRLSEDQLRGIIGGGLFVGNRQATTGQRPTVGYGG